jgi:hypothetical protein
VCWGVGQRVLGCERGIMYEMAVYVSVRNRGIEGWVFSWALLTDGSPLGSEWRFDRRNQRVPRFRIAGPETAKGTD